MEKWIMENYENLELEAKAIEETIALCFKQKSSQEVVQDALQSFRRAPVDEENLIEKMAKEILIEVARIKRITENQKRELIKFLIERFEVNYRVDYSYIFEKQVA